MFKKNSLPDSLIFILGCQRSGTTWLANIFDASPDIILFMEPFAPSYGIFPEFPDTSYFLENSSPYLNNLLQVEMPERLLHYKSLIFRQSVINPKYFRIERCLANKLRRFVPSRWQEFIRKFELLNLNRMDSSYCLYPKNTKPSIWAIKELRLAGKIPVLLKALPSSHFVIIIRHPCATVQSILKWFEQGRLGELRQDLETYFEKIEVQSVSTHYRNLIIRYRKGNLSHKIALYWRISYETMFRKLEKYQSVQFLVYEELASNPQKKIKELFDFLNVPFHSNVEHYIDYSSNKPTESPGAIETTRVSSEYYKKWRNSIPSFVDESVMEVVEDSQILSWIEPFYDHS